MDADSPAYGCGGKSPGGIGLGLDKETCPAPGGAGLGICGRMIFLILAPSSSFIPLHDPLYEHRMYLSLATVVCLAVMGLYLVAGRRSLIVFVVVGIGLGLLTWRRNWDYRSDLAMQFGEVAQRPNDPLAHYNAGVALWKAGWIQEAIGQYQQALKIDPDLAGVHYNLGVALEAVGRAQEAMGHYEEAVRLKPDYVAAYYSLGNAFEKAGRLQDAMENYEQALRLKPDLAEAHYNLGTAFLRLGKFQEAMEHFQQVLRLKPDYAEAQNNLGIALARLGKLPEAIDHWKRAVWSDPDFADAHNNLGIALIRQGRAQEAVEHFRQALRIAPDMAEAHYNLGLALEQMGQVQGAIGHYEQALRLKPDYTRKRRSGSRDCVRLKVGKRGGEAQFLDQLRFWLPRMRRDVISCLNQPTRRLHVSCRLCCEVRTTSRRRTGRRKNWKRS